MVRADDEILKWLAKTDLEITPAVLARNISYSRQHCNDRLQELANRGLVERPERGWYRISDRGRDYISRNVTVAELEDLPD